MVISILGRHFHTCQVCKCSMSFDKGLFINYVSKILPIFDPPPLPLRKQVYYISLCSGISISLTPPPPSPAYVVYGCPLTGLHNRVFQWCYCFIATKNNKTAEIPFINPVVVDRIMNTWRVYHVFIYCLKFNVDRIKIIPVILSGELLWPLVLWRCFLLHWGLI